MIQTMFSGNITRVVIIVVVLYTAFFTCANAQTASSTTSYKKGIFTTSAKLQANTSYTEVQATINTFISQYNNNLNALFGWALKDLKLKGENDDFIMFNIKSHTLKNNTIAGIMDISIPKAFNKKYKDVKYNVVLKKTKDTPQEIEIQYSLTDCEEVIESAYAIFKIKFQGQSTAVYTLDVDVKLKKFYNTIMSKSLYESNIAWRFSKLLENLNKASK